ncbi:MAG: glycosyl transferase, group 1 [Microgenomates group bacterium GW2011_GWA1_48_10]|uniref:Glycosyltransferase subfamily 4-like N-terminal domain-containing protein n=1 Tax=Candidatus Gottesmanbacteria bacterium RIFCSPHIGHO2_01_FULL_47_48 TaxID=1798381 RepID=A0A1F6A361_9BACT|nr:MAG: glycosyl transferase, group 1 [Microgenomates group bacterium GW2011_GWA1_48_10]OGG19151.1 MAG: hypothetical protein A2721_01900 [Candidatus Gottesmanbacteria bacterium RIFCSPHIGHO2_01_FULL_47_48]
MKIVIDARFWGPKHTGLGIYTQKLVENLAKIDHQNDYTLLVRQKVDSPFKQKIVDADAYSLKEQLVLPLTLYALSPDLVHFPSINVPIFYFGKYVVTVHDLIKHDSRGRETTTKDPLIYWIKYLVYRCVFWWATSFAKAIMVPSNEVKKRLNKPNVYVTYESA